MVFRYYLVWVAPGWSLGEIDQMSAMEQALIATRCGLRKFAAKLRRNFIYINQNKGGYYKFSI